jgi:hypothetical protein
MADSSWKDGLFLKVSTFPFPYTLSLISKTNHLFRLSTLFAISSS